jgi:hypothetical protein
VSKSAFEHARGRYRFDPGVDRASGMRRVLGEVWQQSPAQQVEVAFAGRRMAPHHHGGPSRRQLCVLPFLVFAFRWSTQGIWSSHVYIGHVACRLPDEMVLSVIPFPPQSADHRRYNVGEHL